MKENFSVFFTCEKKCRKKCEKKKAWFQLSDLSDLEDYFPDLAGLDRKTNFSVVLYAHWRKFFDTEFLLKVFSGSWKKIKKSSGKKSLHPGPDPCRLFPEPEEKIEESPEKKSGPVRTGRTSKKFPRTFFANIFFST